LSSVRYSRRPKNSSCPPLTGLGAAVEVAAAAGQDAPAAAERFVASLKS
jgi:hypothetical protein